MSPRYDDANPNDLGDDLDAFLLAVRAASPRLAVPMHLMELSHPPGGGRESYRMALDFRARAEQQGCLFTVLAPGERLDVPVDQDR